MQGHDTFRHAVDRLSEATLEAAAAAGLGLARRSTSSSTTRPTGGSSRAVGERLGLPPDRVVDCIAALRQHLGGDDPARAREAARRRAACATGTAGAAGRLRRRPHLGRDGGRVGDAMSAIAA